MQNTLLGLGDKLNSGSVIVLSKDQINQIVERYVNGESPSILGREFGVSSQTVAGHVKKAGVQSRSEQRIEEISRQSNLISDLYSKGQSIKGISNTIGISQIAITNRLNELKMPIKSISELAKEKNPVNEYWFDIIDCAEKAWALGWMATDGCVRDKGTRRGQRGVTLSLNIKDKEITESFHSFIGGTCRSNERLKTTSWCVYSDHLNDSLRSYGIVPRKTSGLKIVLDKIPEQYQRDFIRGCIEGDGCISESKGRWTFSFGSASLGFIEQIVELLPLHPIIHKKKDKDFYYIATQRVDSILRWVYLPSEVFLERKKMKAMRALEQKWI
jgi:hypothetical protein